MVDAKAHYIWHLTQIVFVALECAATALLVLRLWTRRRMIGKLAHDDASLIAAWISMTLAFFLTIASGSDMNAFLAGAGPSNAVTTFVKFKDFALGFSICMVKLSILPCLLQIHRSRTAEREMLYIIAVVVFVTTIVGGMFSLLTCGPTAALYGTTTECEISATYNQVLVACIGFDAVSSAALCLLSIHGLVLAQVGPLVKTATSAVVALGVAGVVAALARLAVLLGSRLDPSQEGVLLSSFVNTIELFCFMAAACLFQSYPAFGLIAEEFGSEEETEQPYAATRPADVESQAFPTIAEVEPGDVIAHAPPSLDVIFTASDDEKSLDLPTPGSSGSDDDEKRLAV